MFVHKDTTIALAFLIVFAVAIHAAPQWTNYPNTYVTYNPLSLWQPTFAGLNTYTTPSPYLGQNVRIWPYVMGQYYYPYYNQYATNYNGAYDANNWNLYNGIYNYGALSKK